MANEGFKRKLTAILSADVEGIALAYSLETFILNNVEPGSTIATESWKSYNFIEGIQCAHEKSYRGSSKAGESL
jgi:hypothetical protein